MSLRLEFEAINLCLRNKKRYLEKHNRKQGAQDYPKTFSLMKKYIFFK